MDVSTRATQVNQFNLKTSKNSSAEVEKNEMIQAFITSSNMPCLSMLSLVENVIVSPKTAFSGWDS
jgi:hypothetical protein